LLFHKKKYVSSGSLSRLAWKRFRSNKAGYGAFLFIILSTLIAIGGYLISPDQTPMVNDQNLLLSLKKPGFSVPVLRIKKNEAIENRSWLGKMLLGQKNSYLTIPYSGIRFNEDHVTITEYTGDTTTGQELKFNLADVVYAIDEKVPVKCTRGILYFTTIDGQKHSAACRELLDNIRKNHLRTKRFLVGTDRYGRDVLSQLILGTRVSLSVGLISVLISLVLGIVMGALAGYYGGKTDAFIMWIINVIWAVPTLLLVIAITFALGKGFWQVFIAVGLTMWVEVARVVRGQFISLKEKEFVEASKALGFNDNRIIFRHVLPNALAPVIVISAANFASAILLEAGLSFLGIGVQPPMPSWGSMIRENYGYIILDYAYLAIMPGIAIMLMVLAFMVAGNALRDALDVRTVE